MPSLIAGVTQGILRDVKSAMMNDMLEALKDASRPPTLRGTGLVLPVLIFNISELFIFFYMNQP